MYAKKYLKYKKKYLNYKNLIGGLLSEKEEEVYKNGKRLFGDDMSIFKVFSKVFTIDLCCLFSIDNNIIDLSLITDCDNVKQSIDKIELLAKESNIHKIILEDGSNIIIHIDGVDYYISLKFLYILCYGFSWYNNLGYKSSNYDNEVRHNISIINLPLFEFINDSLILDEFLRVFPKYNKYNIIKDIMNDIKTNKITTNEQVKIINKIFNIAKDKILYNIHLEKIINSI